MIMVIWYIKQSLKYYKEKTLLTIVQILIKDCTVDRVKRTSL